MAWCGVLTPFDLLQALGITSCFVEFVGAMLAATGGVEPLLEEAEHAGYATDGCSYHRAVLGAAIQGLMPEPDFLIASTCPCSGGIAVLENLAHMFSKDLFVLNVPQEESEQNIQYLADQIKDMVEFIAHHTGEPLDQNKLRQAVEKTNKAREIMQDMYRLAQKVPSPTDGRLLINFGLVILLFLGTDSAIEIAQAYKDEFSARIERGIQGVPDEKLRLLWIQNRIQFKNPLVELLEKEYQANIVCDELNDIYWDSIDPDDPFTGMARRAIAKPLNVNMQSRVDHLQKLARNYKLDGAINPCHWGCRQGTGARGLISEGLKEINVPVLNLEVDCMDTRNFAEGQLRTRIEAFVEMLETRPRQWQ